MNRCKSRSSTGILVKSFLIMLLISASNVDWFLFVDEVKGPVSVRVTEAGFS